MVNFKDVPLSQLQVELGEKDKVLEVEVKGCTPFCGIKGPLSIDEFNKVVSRKFINKNFTAPSYVELEKEKEIPGRDLRKVYQCSRMVLSPNPRGSNFDDVPTLSCIGCQHYGGR